MRESADRVNRHPFIATTEEVRAFLAGRKTQARRPMTPQPADVDQDQGGVALLYETGRDGERAKTIGEPPFTSPFGTAGDLLWVQEPTAFWHDRDGAKHRVLGRLADVHDPEWNGLGCDDPWWLDVDWYAAAQMPRWASRLTLRLTDLRVELLRELSAADCRAEGITLDHHKTGSTLDHLVGGSMWQGEFKARWDAVHATQGHGFSANPWVWVPTFEVVDADAGDPVLPQGAEA